MDFADTLMAAGQRFAPAWTDYLAYVDAVKSLITAIPHQVVTTAIWAGLIFWAARKYEGPMTRLIVALHHRIMTGSGVKLGVLEITPTPDSVVQMQAAADAATASSVPPQEESGVEDTDGRTQDSDEPAAKPSAQARPEGHAEARAANAENDAPARTYRSNWIKTRRGRFVLEQGGDMLALYYHAEDLVFQMLQKQYGEKLQRHVTLGGVFAVDAVIGDPLHLTVVDVLLAGPSSGANLPFKLQNMYANLQVPELAHWGITEVRQIVVYTEDTNQNELKKHVARAHRKWNSFQTSISLVVQVCAMADLEAQSGGEG